jgi:hypothetical protein
MNDVGGLGEGTDAHPMPWTSVELVLDRRRFVDPATILREWQQANLEWSVSYVYQDDVMKRALDAVPTSSLRSWLSARPELAVDFGRFMTAAANGRTMSVHPALHRSYLSLIPECPNGCIILNGRGSATWAIALTEGSVFCASTSRVVSRLVEHKTDMGFAAIVRAVASALRLLDAGVPLLMQLDGSEAYRARPKRGVRVADRLWNRSRWERDMISQLRRASPLSRQLCQLALAETATVIMDRTYDG